MWTLIFYELNSNVTTLSFSSQNSYSIFKLWIQKHHSHFHWFKLEIPRLYHLAFLLPFFCFELFAFKNYKLFFSAEENNRNYNGNFQGGHCSIDRGLADAFLPFLLLPGLQSVVKWREPQQRKQWQIPTSFSTNYIMKSLH